jgi:hypothetical protein
MVLGWFVNISVGRDSWAPKFRAFLDPRKRWTKVVCQSKSTQRAPVISQASPLWLLWRAVARYRLGCEERLQAQAGDDVAVARVPCSSPKDSKAVPGYRTPESQDEPADNSDHHASMNPDERKAFHRGCQFLAGIDTGIDNLRALRLLCGSYSSLGPSFTS